MKFDCLIVVSAKPSISSALLGEKNALVLRYRVEIVKSDKEIYIYEGDGRKNPSIFTGCASEFTPPK